jgi:hypothetical protein
MLANIIHIFAHAHKMPTTFQPCLEEITLLLRLFLVTAQKLLQILFKDLLEHNAQTLVSTYLKSTHTT